MSNRKISRPIEILLVEDNPGDVRLTREVLRESKVRSTLHVVEDGMKAMAYLYRESEYADAVRPDIVLLDLNLPKKDGREVLIGIKTDEDLKRIPVVILTTSEDERDILEAYNNHVNCYVTKPLDMDQFTKIVRSIEDFWLTIAKLPPN